jgi:hypothetical protein
MSSATPAAQPSVAPFEIHFVHFDFLGGQAIPLRNHVTDIPLGLTPEWDSNGRNELVAYVRGATPQVQAVFQGTPAADGSYIVGAEGTHSNLAEVQVDLKFDAGTGLSQPVSFSFTDQLPNVIGRHQIAFDWYVLDSADPSQRSPAGNTAHIVCTTWRAMVPNPDQRLWPWAYARLVEWTSQWAAGCDNEKAISDAIINNLASSGLRYGVSEHRVREMLIRGGGMCGGWYLMFQQMAHCQGVFIHRRFFRVHWRSLPTGEERWCALVIRSGGLNQPEPTHPRTAFRDHDGPLADVGTAALTVRVECRYRFWGMRGAWGDGHCINFLEHAGRLYLYDACFGAGPFEIDGPLPPDDSSVWGSQQLASFKACYLDAAVDYMLGSLYNRGYLWRSSRGTTFTPESIGVTVRTDQIPETDAGIDGLTFGWLG